MNRDLDWISVPQGHVSCGTPENEIDNVVQRHRDLILPRSFFAKEAPRHLVYVSAFHIMQVPVTRGLWNAFCAATERTLERMPGDENLPASDRTYNQATAFARWVSEDLERTVRPPSEYQWERAARGSDEREYPWGSEFNHEAANLCEHGVGAEIPVGQLPLGASPFGVLDMAGNVDEWTSSVYSPYPGAPLDVPPTEPWAGDPHITRGGGYMHHRDLARCARRHAIYPPLTGAAIRLVLLD
ncbi:MAG: SUMF1/EgtB/PvdO family nonheme iron enzyme [Acidimicrobiales bacterium]